MKRFADPLVVLALLTAALAGCGGGEEDSPNTAVSTTAQRGTTAAQEQPATPKDRSPSSNPTNPPHQDVPIGEPIPGSKAVAPGVPTTRGGDNSIQAFGTEGEEGPREEAVSNFLAYREARLAGEFDTACALASAEFRGQFEQLLEKANAKGDVEKPKDCPEILELFTPDQAKAELREKSQVSEVLSFRVEEPYAYLIFKGAEDSVMYIAMSDADGQWRVNVLEPEAFSN